MTDIKTVIRNAGWVSELRALRLFQKNGWTCQPSLHYLDLDEQRARETDFWAFREISMRGAVARFNVVAEVKKRTRSWVVVRHPLGKAVDAWENPHIALSPPDDLLAMESDISRHSLLESCGWLSHRLYEVASQTGDSQKQRGKETEEKEAGFQACKGLEAVFAREKIRVAREQLAPAAYVSIFKPMIIFDGTLYSADIDDAGELVVEQVDEAPLQFYYQSPAYDRGQYRIDVVTLKGLPNYLDLTERRLYEMAARLSTRGGSSNVRD